MGEWINAADAAQRLGVKQATLYAYVSRGMLARRRGEDGRSSLFEADEVARLVERGQRGEPRRAAGTADFVIESELTEVADGRLRYRGLEVTKLALWRPFEEVAAWLWTGGLGHSGLGHDGPWQATPEAVAAGAGAQAALPEGTLPLERLRVIVPAMAATDPLRLHLDPPAVIAAGRTIIAGMIDCLPDPGSPAQNGSPARLAEGGIAGRFWYKICPRRPDPGLLGALRAAMALLADHELAASTFAARMAASVRADPYAVVATGLGALGGGLNANPRHGGASLGAETMLAAAREPADAVRVVGDLLRRGERIPGFGDFHHGGRGADQGHQADPRAQALLDLIRKAAPRSARYAVAEAVLAETGRRSLPEPTVDFALATLTSVAGMIPGAGEAVFAVARAAGWIAHALEEYAKNAPLRPRTVYTGPHPVASRNLTGNEQAPDGISAKSQLIGERNARWPSAVSTTPSCTCTACSAPWTSTGRPSASRSGRRSPAAPRSCAHRTRPTTTTSACSRSAPGTRPTSPNTPASTTWPGRSARWATWSTSGPGCWPPEPWWGRATTACPSRCTPRTPAASSSRSCGGCPPRTGRRNWPTAA